MSNSMGDNMSDELIYSINKYLGKPRRYTEGGDGMGEHYLVEWVEYTAYKEEVRKLTEIISKLKAENSVEYNRGYSAGKSAGADYNMRNY